MLLLKISGLIEASIIGKCVSKTDTHFRFKVAMKVWNTHNHVSLLLNKNPGPASPQKQQDSVVS